MPPCTKLTRDSAGKNNGGTSKCGQKGYVVVVTTNLVTMLVQPREKLTGIRFKGRYGANSSTKGGKMGEGGEKLRQGLGRFKVRTKCLRRDDEAGFRRGGDGLLNCRDHCEELVIRTFSNRCRGSARSHRPR